MVAVEDLREIDAERLRQLPAGIDCWGAHEELSVSAVYLETEKDMAAYLEASVNARRKLHILGGTKIAHSASGVPVLRRLGLPAPVAWPDNLRILGTLMEGLPQLCMLAHAVGVAADVDEVAVVKNAYHRITRALTTKTGSR